MLSLFDKGLCKCMCVFMWSHFVRNSGSGEAKKIQSQKENRKVSFEYKKVNIIIHQYKKYNRKNDLTS